MKIGPTPNLVGSASGSVTMSGTAASQSFKPYKCPPGKYAMAFCYGSITQYVSGIAVLAGVYFRNSVITAMRHEEVGSSASGSGVTLTLPIYKSGPIFLSAGEELEIGRYGSAGGSGSSGTVTWLVKEFSI